MHISACVHSEHFKSSFDMFCLYFVSFVLKYEFQQAHRADSEIVFSSHQLLHWAACEGTL